MPVFNPPVRKPDYKRNAQISLLPGGPRVLTPGLEHPDFLTKDVPATASDAVNRLLHRGSDL